MRLLPGVTVDQADATLRGEETRWSNVSGESDRYLAYTDAVETTYAQLKQTFATPDLGPTLRSEAYWNILSMASSQA